MNNSHQKQSFKYIEKTSFFEMCFFTSINFLFNGKRESLFKTKFLFLIYEFVYFFLGMINL